MALEIRTPFTVSAVTSRLCRIGTPDRFSTPKTREKRARAVLVEQVRRSGTRSLKASQISRPRFVLK